MKKAIEFSICVCLFSWAAYAAVMLACGSMLSDSSILMTLFKSLYMFFPLLVAAVLKTARHERVFGKGSFRLNLDWKWLFAILCPILVVLLSVLVSALLPGVRLHYGAEGIISMSGLEGEAADAVRAQLEAVPPSVMLFSTLVEAVIAGCTINAVFAFGEEFGWRGYMVEALKGQKFIVSAVLIGLVWGIWHAPLILAGHNYPQHPVAGVPMMCIFCLLFGVIELYFRLATGSVVAAACIHGTLNALAGVVLILVEGGNDLLIGTTGVAGFLACLVVIAGIWVYDTKISGKNLLKSSID